MFKFMLGLDSSKGRMFVHAIKVAKSGMSLLLTRIYELLMSNFSSKRIVLGVRTLEPEYIFIVVALIAGLCFLVSIPPLAAYDETEHLFRSYQLSELNLFSDKTDAPNVVGVKKGLGYGGLLPKSMVDAASNLRWSVQTSESSDKSFIAGSLKNNLGVPLSASDKKWVRFDNTAINSPIAYLPQTVGVFIGRLMNLGPVWLIYAGRLTNLLVWLVIMFVSIRILPIGKWVYTVIALNPAFLALSGTLSPDVVAGSLVALFVAIIIKTQYEKDRISLASKLVIMVLASTIALVKFVYFPIILLLFIIPPRIMNLKWKLFGFVIALLFCLSWNIAVLPVTAQIPNYFNVLGHVSSVDQIHSIISGPGAFIQTMFWNMFGSPSVVVSYRYLYEIADNVVPFWSILLWIFAFIISFLIKEKTSNVLDNKSKLAFMGVAIVASGAIVMSLYTGWSLVGSGVVLGVQGRYFFPISFLLVSLLIGQKFYLSGDVNKARRAIVFCLILSILSAIMVVVWRYWFGIRP